MSTFNPQVGATTGLRISSGGGQGAGVRASARSGVAMRAAMNRESRSQFERQLAQSQEQFDTSMGIQQKQFKKSRQAGQDAAEQARRQGEKA